jgi:hypothetical protein
LLREYSILLPNFAAAFVHVGIFSVIISCSTYHSLKKNSPVQKRWYTNQTAYTYT